MRTNVQFDEELMEEAKKLTGAQTYREVIDLALKSLIHQKKRKKLTDLFGEIKFEKNYNYKKMRE